MNSEEIREAFDHVFDHAVVFHGFADHMRDYDVFVDVTADPRTGIAPEHLRYRFKHCVRATVTYPGMTLVVESPEARQWADALKVPFHEATIETNGHTIALIFSDLVVDAIGPGHAPFVVPT